ncbi:hypothetical protein CSA08_01655 [Candidatus Gracilibacteria bacterium]|nr:MAG: hypothetical protein CSA08_01655 [Candidatus Gracilibacteria bacterium]
MIISILASIGSDNLGDELILKNEINILEKKYSPEKVYFFVYSYDYKNPFYKKDNICYKEYFPIGSGKKRNFLRNIKDFFVFLKITFKSDLIVIGGGGIIYDEEKQKTRSPLDLWIFRTNIFRLFFKKFIFFRVGIDIKNENNLYKVKKIFKKAANIEVRDFNSFKLLQSLAINSEIEKDPVFYDNGDFHDKNFCIKKTSSTKFKISDLNHINFEGKKVGIAFRSNYLSVSKGNEMTKFEKKLETLKVEEIINHIKKSNGEVILLPHSFHKTDIMANDYTFLKQFSDKHNLVIGTNMQEVYSFYKERKIDICLSMRLHSIILATVYEIPFIALSYSTKTDEVLVGK